MIENLVVGVMVLGACGWLGGKYLRKKRRPTGCEGCSGCPASGMRGRRTT